MECGKLTAKLRDAVPVCFIENGKEVKRFKNIEIPDEIKQLPFVDFKFDVPASGAITFKIMFEAGILPTEWPEARQRKSRGVIKTAEIPKETADMLAASIKNGGYADAETVAAMNEAAEEATQPEEIPDAIEAAQEEVEGQPETEILEAQEPELADEIPAEEPGIMAEAFNVTGEQRKALVAAISGFTGEQPKYQNAPTFAYIIGEYTVDKQGTVTGPANEALITILQAKGFIAE